ncbi:MAG: RagB/SusD family nutrient uptake outer membrane protein [Ginsengibacter sp.]
MQKRLIIISVILLFTLGSCKKWLEITQEDRVMEKELFNSKSGFMTALNGVYVEMNSEKLYGGKMMVDGFDVMAQYYLTSAYHAYIDYAQYKSDQEVFKATFDQIWIRFYELIANCNTIIEQCDSKKELLGENYYNIIKGEAIGLRAFFHFELLKIFGPVYSQNSEMVSIPYKQTSNLIISPLLKASEVKSLIMRDFAEAESLLAKSDPIITEGVLFSEDPLGAPNDFRYRSVRLNFYAIQALMARASLYFGDTQNALKYAGNLIQELHVDKQWFPFILNSANPQTDDRVYQSELLFAMYNTKRTDIFKNYFINNLSDLGVLRMDETMLSNLFEPGDYRFRYQWEFLKNPEEKQQLYFIKYKDVDASTLKTYRYLVPMIRIIEMYFIMAEVEQDAGKALAYLNKARNARNLPDLSGVASINEEIEKEYKREFAGEGQLFFYYKRLNKQQIPDGNNPGAKITMNTDKYVLSLPDSKKTTGKF